MKIIGVDNLARESVADVLWLDGVYDWVLAERICKKLNEGLGDGPGTYYKVVGDDYRLSRGMEDLV